MRIPIALALVSILFSACTKSSPGKEVADANIVEYPAQGNRYTLVVIEDKISESQAKKMARERAAKITVKQGNRYFVILSEQKIQVVRPNAPRMPDNMYQELILQDSFGQQTLGQDIGPNGTVFPGLRFIFECYAEKPMGRNSLDACKYTNCQ